MMRRAPIRSPRTILALLTALNLLNYLDRYVVAAVLAPMSKELALNDTSAGFLATVFLVGYFATSPFFGALADRGQRKGLIALGVGVWSLATAATGLTGDSPRITIPLGGTQIDLPVALVAARALVGVGEASYATLAPTIIDDLAPPEQKGRWLSVFFIATPVGSALGYVLGGLMANHFGWRAAFYVAGGPGIVAALLCLLIAEPSRKLATTKASAFAAIEHFKTRRLYRRGVLGYTAATFALGAFAFWGPTFITRTYGMPAGKAAFVFGLITVAGGLIGTLAGGAWADRRTRTEHAPPDDSGIEDEADRKVAYSNLWVCSVSSFVAAPIALAAFFSPTATMFFVLVFFCEACIFLGTSPINAVLLRSVPSEARARGLALAIFAIHILGDMWSPMIVGSVADMTTIRTGVLVLPVAFGVSGLLWWVRPGPSSGADLRGRGATRG